MRLSLILAVVLAVPRLQVHEVVFDRTGGFTGISKVAMALKGHRKKVRSLDFSPDLTKMVTASEDTQLKVSRGWVQ